MFVDFNILNQLGSPSINSNTFANRPAAGQTGRLFVSTDTFEIYRDNGTSWDLIGGPGAGTITGTGAATQVAYFTGAQTIGSSSNLFWDNTNTRLGIGTSTPGVRLDIHGTGIMQHINSTGATANALMAFQRTGTNVWRIGDQYNGGNNYYELHNTALGNNALEVLGATNKTTFLATENYTTGLATGDQFTYNLTVPGGTNFSSPNAIHAVNSYLNLSLGGNTTTPAGTRQGLEGNSRISFTGAGTLTMTQGSTVRAWSSLGSVYSFNGSAVGTITHLAGLRVCFPDNIGSAVNITNNYGVLINDQTAGLGTVNYSNRWGVYQEGASDLNYFNGNLLLGSTTNSGQRLQVTGTALFTGAVTGVGNSSTYTVTASGALAASKRITSTLVAAANNDVLVGLDVNPTFTNGAFTGVGNIGARIGGSTGVNITSSGIGVGGVNNSAFGLDVVKASSQVRIQSTTGTNTAYVAPQNTGGAFYVGIDSSTGGLSGTAYAAMLQYSGAFPMVFFTSNLERLRIFGNGNVGINTTIDGGFRFDVNGTTRLNGVVTIGTSGVTLQNISSNTLLVTAAAGLTISSDIWNTNASAAAFINNGFITKTYRTWTNDNQNENHHVFDLSRTITSNIAGTRKTIVRSIGTQATTAASTIRMFDAIPTDNSVAIANTVIGYFADVSGGSNTSALRYAAIFTGGTTGIGTSTPDASAQLDVTSTSKGFLPPRMTGAQAEAIGTPAAGLMVYANNGNGVTITTTGWWGYDGATWVKLN
jgi:hypothetical protein